MVASGSFSGIGLDGRESMQLLFSVFFVMGAVELWIADWSMIVLRASNVMNQPALEAAALELDGDI